MTNVSVLTAAALSVFFLTGCSGLSIHDNPHSALTPEVRSKIHTTKVIIGFDPTGQYQNTPVTVTNAQQYGIVGVITAAITGSVLENARQNHERLMVAIQDAAIDFNVGNQFRSEFEPAVRRLTWLGVTSVTREPSELRGNAEALAKQADEDALLVTDIRFAMASDLSKYTITAYAQLRPRDSQGYAQTEVTEDGVLFRRKYVFDYSLERPDANEEQAAQLWAGNNGALVKRALRDGISQVVRSIVKDLDPISGLASTALSADPPHKEQ